MNVAMVALLGIGSVISAHKDWITQAPCRVVLEAAEHAPEGITAWWNLEDGQVVGCAIGGPTGETLVEWRTEK